MNHTFYKVTDVSTAISAACEIEKLCFCDPWIIDENMLSRGYYLQVVKDDIGNYAGYILFSDICGEIDLHRIAVLKEFRNKGCGYFLLELMTQTVKSMDASCIFLEVRSQNKPAVKLYEKFGFENISIRKNYYSNPVDDAVIMKFTNF